MIAQMSRKSKHPEEEKMLNAYNGTVCFDGAVMDYVRFGSGPKTLVVLPGLGDGLRTVKGTAIPMALMYRSLGSAYTVYMFSRRRDLPSGFTIADMADDQAKAMQALGIERADAVGVSMGGMILQQWAIRHPQQLDRIVLAVTAAQPNELMIRRVGEWVNMARADDYTALMRSNVRHIYSEAYNRRNQWLTPLVSLLSRPKNYDRFLTQASACIRHDAHEQLGGIASPVLVVGGEQDDVLGAEASRELAALIPQAKLHMYAQWGHGLYEEAPDFWSVVLGFLQDA